MYEGYLYTSTVDFLATSETDMIYTWTLLVIGYIVPNILILLSHLAIITTYRNNNFDTWMARQGAVEPRNHFVNNHRLAVRQTYPAFVYLDSECSFASTLMP